MAVSRAGTRLGKTVVVCATGASGARLAGRFLHHLLAHSHIGEVRFVPSRAFALVLREEEGEGLEAFLKPLARDRRLVLHAEDDLGAPVASGSFPVDGTVVIPASMATVGAVASGAGRDLIHRACDVALKEGRPLILVPRETPLSLIHLRNLVTLREAGATIAPFMPAFYQKPATVEDVVDHFLMRIFDLLGLEAELSRRWGNVEDAGRGGRGEGGRKSEKREPGESAKR
jgi:flavin prenyltransferase